MPDMFWMMLAGSLAAGGAGYFLIQWTTTRSTLAEMTNVERAQAQIAEDERKRNRRSPKRWALDELRRAGYRGDPAPIVLSMALAYMVLTLVLQMFGVDGPLAGIVAIPALGGVTWMARTMYWRRRRKAFTWQLKQLFDLVRGQLEAGWGMSRALELTVPTLADPLRTEFQEALDATRAGRELIESLKDLRQSYPSRGFDLFIAVLEVDRDQGGKVAGTIQRAGEMLAAEFKLTEEANSELATAKQTFYGVGLLLGMIAFRQIASPMSREAYSSPAGIAVISVMFTWAGIGVFTVQQSFRKAAGEL
jgi:Flp pilus assembly protein TadB